MVATASLTRVALKTAVTGLLLVALAGATGFLLGRSRFGSTDEQSLAHIEAELRQRFDRAAETLGAIGNRVTLSSDVIEAAPRDDAALRQLFDVLAGALPTEGSPSLGVTIYSHPDPTPLAWSGRVSDLPRERIEGPAALFVAPRGRLIRLEPVLDTTHPGSGRLGTMVVEQWLGEDSPAARRGETLLLATSIAPVTLRTSFGAARTGSAYSFLIPSRDGQVLMEATVDASDLAAARARWNQNVQSIVWVIVGLTLVALGGVVFARRRRVREARAALLTTLGTLALFAVARVVFQWASLPFANPASSLDPVELLLTSTFLVVVVWMLLDLIERRRVARPHRRLVRESAGSIGVTACIYLAAGFLGAGLLWSYEGLLQSTVAQASVDLAHFSLHPVVAPRLGLAFGLVLLHAAVIWSAALLLRIAAIAWRRVRSGTLRAAAAASWSGGAAVAVLSARNAAGPVPLAPLALALAAAGFLAWALGQPRGRTRRASEATRLLALYLAILIPALAMYPSLHAFATDAKEQLVAGTLAPLAASQREDLRTRRMPRALEEIDEMPTLVDFVTSADEDAAPTTDRAFLVWSGTELARFRLTSAVELYGATGRLVSRFARNLPDYEYAPAQFVARNCADWDLYEEVSPFGSRERHVLRASRGICNSAKQLVGGVVVRAMFAYRDLPFLSSSETRYADALEPEHSPLDEGAPGRDVEFSVYGWSRAPIYASGTRVWPLSDRVFAQMAEARTPVWDTVTQGSDSFRVYYLNDRGGIYALGYPSVTPFGHVVNVAELVTLTFVLYLLILLVIAVFSITSPGPATGRALLRELRSSFYRKLFLFFVLASVVPVGILFFATRAYFLAQLRAGVEQGAINTATIAQRLVEDYAALQQGSSRAFETLDDQIMILVGRAIDQDVDLFDGPRLQATSERDLYASGVLSSRTPSEVYKEIAVDRRPTYAGVETYGRSFYQLAAAPVRAGGREGIVTVPQTLRQVEIERQIDELNRQVVLGLVLFVLLGAGIGYSMAERIADPVNRLTRATRRIARGDLDARIAATSSDELRRLVEDFNRMADDLKRQRTELERTQRLEAWADMARQVAHDIKNPLTPIQLSAEHAQRVNQDRGRPLSPALDECIASILTQVKLLRQIAAEFSSFASSPVAHPEPSVVPELVESVVEPYRAGLSGRVGIDVKAGPDLPQVLVDRTLFARALTNVIENALHAMPGGGQLLIASEAAFDGQPVATHVTVSVRDTGVGMEPDDLAKIFEPYFSTRATGTGLGLTIAKRNIELNGGTIGVTSQRGEGTTVTITLPARPPAEEPAATG